MLLPRLGPRAPRTRIALAATGVAALAAALAAPARAQVIRFPQRQHPSVWVSLGAGVRQFGDVVDDGTTSSAWDFETAPEFRASIEYERRGGTSFGLAATYARPSLFYTLAPEGAAAQRTDATGRIYSVAALFRAGSGAGLHQVIEVSLGMRQYSGFRVEDTGAALPPTTADRDFTAALGFGIGYPLGQRAAVSLVQDADFTFHQRDKAPASGFDGGIHRGYVTRLGLRYGFGNRSRR